jgi:predicted small integral membrane protein
VSRTVRALVALWAAITASAFFALLVAGMAITEKDQEPWTTLGTVSITVLGGCLFFGVLGAVYRHLADLPAE